MSASLEDNLAFLDDAADRVLAAIEEQRTGTIAAETAYKISAQNSPEQIYRRAESNNRSRSASAPRGRSTAGNNRSTAEAASSMLYDMPRMSGDPSVPASSAGESAKAGDSSSTIGWEKKIELLMKKHRFVEDRLKKIEKENEANCEISRQAQEAAEKLTEAQKADKKLILGLRTQLSGMKSRLDVMTATTLPVLPPSAEEFINNAPGDADRGTTGASSSAWKEMIQRTVKFEIAKATEELLAKCASEQMRVCSQFYEKQQQRGTAGVIGNENHDIFNRSAGVEQFSAMQREIVRMSADVDRVKLRQSQLDAALQDVKSGTSSRTLKAEEMRKKAHKAQRVEVEEFLSKSQRKVNEALTGLKRDTANIQQIKDELESSVDRFGHVFSEHESRLKRHDQSKEEVYSELERLVNLADDLQRRLDSTDRTLETLLKNSSDASAASDLVRIQGEKLDALDEKVTALREDCKIATGLADATMTPVDALAGSIDGLNEKFEARTDTLKIKLDEIIAQSAETNKKTTARIKEVIESVKGVATIRQSVEEVLQEVDSRSQYDAQWAYKLHAGVQKQEVAFAELFTEFAAVKEFVSSKVDVEHVNDLKKSLTAMVEESKKHCRDLVNTENNRTSELLTSLIDTQMQQMVAEMRQCVLESREQMQFEGQERLQEHNAIVAENFTRVNDALTELQALQDQLIAEHEDSSRFNNENLRIINEKINTVEQRLETAEQRADGLQAACDGNVGKVDSIEGKLNTDLKNLSQEIKGLESKLDDQISLNTETMEKIENSSVQSASVQEMQHAVDSELQRMKKQMKDSEKLAHNLRKEQEETVHDIKVNAMKQAAEVQIQAEQIAALVSLQDVTNNLQEEMKRTQTEAFNSKNELEVSLMQLSERVDSISTAAANDDSYNEAYDAIKTSLATVSQDLLELVRDVDTRLRADIAEGRRSLHEHKTEQAAYATSVKEQLGAQERKLSSQERFYRERLTNVDEKINSVEKKIDSVDVVNNRSIEGITTIRNDYETLKTEHERVAHVVFEMQAAASTNKETEKLQNDMAQRLRDEWNELLGEKASSVDLEALRAQVENKVTVDCVESLQLSFNSFTGNFIEQANDLQSQIKATEEQIKDNTDVISMLRDAHAQSVEDHTEKMNNIAATVETQMEEVKQDMKNSVTQQLEAWGEQLEEVANDTADRVNNLEKSMTAITDDAKEWRQTISDLATVERTVEQLSITVDGIRRAIRELQRMANTTSSSTTLRSPSMEDRTTTYQQMLLGVSSVEEQLEKIKNVTKEHTAQLESFDGRISTLNMEVKGKLSDFVRSTELLAGKLELLTDLETKIESTENDVMTLNQSYNDHCNDMIAKEKDTNKEIVQLKAHIQELSEQIAITGTIHSGVEQSEDVSALASLQMHVSTLEKQQLTSIENVQLTLQEVQDSLTSTRSELTGRIDNAEGNIDAAITILEELRGSTLSTEEDAKCNAMKVSEIQSTLSQHSEQLNSIEENIEQALEQQNGRLKAQMNDVNQKIITIQDDDRSRGQRMSNMEQRLLHSEASTKEKLSAMTTKVDTTVDKIIRQTAESSHKLHDLEEIFAGFDETVKASNDQFDNRLSALELTTAEQQTELSNQIDEVNELCQSLVKATGEDMENVTSRLDVLESRLLADANDSDDSPQTPWHVTEELAIALDELDAT